MLSLDHFLGLSFVSIRNSRRFILALVCLCALAGRAQAEPPTVAGFSPASGAVDSTVVIRGSNFLPPLTITFAGNARTAGDFSANQITVAVPAGAQSGPIIVTTSEGSASTGAFTVASGSDASASLPAVSLTASTPTAKSGSGAPGIVTVNLSIAASADLTVNYKAAGAAVNGTDYTLLKGKVKIKAGKTSKDIKITATGNLSGAAKKTVKLTVEPGTGYTVKDNTPVKVKLSAGS